jgi:hypothetical protein
MDNYKIIDTPAEVEEKKTGKIKPSKKIAQFTATALGINFIAKEATIEGRYISGLGLDDVVFKLTICDDDTIDFEEISETNKTDFETRKRYIEDILNSDTVPYNKLSVFPDYKFISVEKFSNRHIELYLAQELVKPIDRLRELSNFENLSESTLSKLDALFADDEDEEVNELQDLVSSLQSRNEIQAEIEIVSPVTKSNYMEEAAKKAKELKLEELKSKLETTSDRLNKERFALNSLSKIIEDLEADVKLTNARIDAMTTEIVLNGYSFYISPSIENKLEIDEAFVAKLLEKLPKNINGKALLKLFEQSKYALHLEKDGEEIINHLELPTEIKEILKNKDVSIQLSDSDNKEKFYILSTEDWHDIVKSFEKAGFFRDIDMAKRLDPLYTVETAKQMLASMGINIPQTAQVKTTPTRIGSETFNNSNINSNTMSNEEDVEDEDELDEDQEEYMDDKFLFAIYKDDTPGITNTLGNVDPEFTIVVTPYTYWKTENCCYDNHTENLLKKKFPLLKSLGQRLGEDSESSYSILDDNFDKFLNLDEILKLLGDAGLKINKDYQDFVSVKDSQMVINEINRLGYNNIII